MTRGFAAPAGSPSPPPGLAQEARATAEEEELEARLEASPPATVPASETANERGVGAQTAGPSVEGRVRGAEAQTPMVA